MVITINASRTASVNLLCKLRNFNPLSKRVNQMQVQFSSMSHEFKSAAFKSKLLLCVVDY